MKQQYPAIGSPVIVRADGAGVVFGNYAGHDGSAIHLTEAVQMWNWCAAQGGTLIDCAQYGVAAERCKFSLGRATVTVFDALALITVTAEAAASIRGVDGGGKWRK